jgi:hypothetical protein
MTRILARLTDAIACAALLMWLLLVPRAYWDDADAWDD